MIIRRLNFEPWKPIRYLSTWHNKMKEEIAAAVDVPRQTVTDKINSFADLSNLAKSGKTLANHEEQDFQVPLYNGFSSQSNKQHYARIKPFN